MFFIFGAPLFQNRSPPSTKRRKALPFAVPLFFGHTARFLPANGGVRAALAATLRDEFGSARRRLAPSGGSLGARKKPTASHLRYGEIIDHLPPECQAKWVKYARGEHRFRTSVPFAGIPPRSAGREYSPRRSFAALGVAYGKPHRAKGGRRRRPCPRARAETPSPGRRTCKRRDCPDRQRPTPWRYRENCKGKHVPESRPQSPRWQKNGGRCGKQRPPFQSAGGPVPALARRSMLGGEHARFLCARALSGHD